MNNSKMVLFLLMFIVLSLPYIFISIKNDIGLLEKEIAHLDGEIDGISVEVKKINAKNNFNVIKSIDSKAKVEIDNSEYDLGVVYKKNGILSTKFSIKNVGNGNLTLGGIVTSCGCTTAKLSSEEVKPGDISELEVFFDPNFHQEPLGSFSRSVFVNTNDPENKELEFKILVDEIKK